MALLPAIGAAQSVGAGAPASTAPAAGAPAAGAPADPPGFDANMFAAPSAPAVSGDAPSLRLQVFGSTGFDVRTERDPLTLEAPAGGVGQGTRGALQPWNSFNTWDLDLFLTATAGRVSFLSENLLEGEIDTGEFRFVIDRLQVSYLATNWLRLKMGRVHTAFGYYNDTYHHGSIFELTTGRPWLVNFEDDGGVLPSHVVGAMIDGTIGLGRAGALHYDVEVGNSRAPDLSTVATFGALSNFKMVNVRLRWLPRFLDGLVIGVNGMVNEIPTFAGGSGGVPRVNAVSEMAGGAHVAYMEHHFHVLLEGAVIRHQDQGTSNVYDTVGGFAELGYAFGAWTPYLRWESIRFSRADDPGWASSIIGNRSIHDLRELRVGLNWRAGEHLALKVEARHLDIDGVVDTTEQSAHFQLSFAF